MLKKLLLLIILIKTLSAYELIDYYRKNGAVKITVKAERLLKSKKFWLRRLQKYDSDFGYYENIQHIIIVDKLFKSLDLYKFQNNEFNLIQTEDILVGKNRGHKRFEGDKKTPTGVYKLVKKLTKVDSFYGPLALVLSYPNIFDKLKGRTGSGIWIHGKPFNQSRNPFTKGCVAMENNKLLKLNRFIRNIDKTLVILESGHLKKVRKDDLAIILSSIYKWLADWRNNKFQKYISFYSKEFKKADGQKFSLFKQYKSRIFKKQEKKKIFISNINISPYPNSYNRNIFLISFYENYRTSSFHWTGEKKLFVEVVNNKMKIIIEK